MKIKKKSIYLESYSGRLITSMWSAFFYFLFVTTISSERKKKELSTIFVWENSVLGRNKTKIVKTIVFVLFLSGVFRNRNWPGNFTPFLSLRPFFAKKFWKSVELKMTFYFCFFSMKITIAFIWDGVYSA